MTEKWHDNAPDESEQIYMQALAIVKVGLTKGFDFESSCARIDIRDKGLREAVIDDVLKVLIAEEHFAKNIPLEEIGRKLNLPVERIEKARKEMFEDIEKSAVDSFYMNSGHGTETDH